MAIKYVYLFGVFILAIIWSILFVYRKDMRKPMMWTGGVYTLYITGLFLVWYALSKYIYFGSAFNPDYWHPETLFNLQAITGAISIEDIFFSFFVGGLAAVIYELVYRKKIQLKPTYDLHVLAIIISFISFFIIGYLIKLNLIYPLILSSFVGAIVLWFERTDLIKHSLAGGLSFVFIYVVAFLIFNFIFPEFISSEYNLNNLSGILMLNIPLEEFLYAFSFGMLWAPIYEYVHGEKLK